MSDLQLSQFPPEILEIIINYIPRSELYRLDGIEYLKKFVLMNIYSSVVITGESFHTISWSVPFILRCIEYSDIIKSKPEFESVTSLIDFLQQNHLPFPKYVRFEHPMDVVIAYNTQPSILEDCIIETDLSIFDNSSMFAFDFRVFCLQRVISLPLKIRQVKYCGIMQEILPKLTHPFARKLTSTSFNEIFALEVALGDDRYQNLVNLEILCEIDQEMIKDIPKSVKKLSCKIKRSESGLTVFGFPSGLRILNVSLTDYRNEYRLNFSILEQLVDLEFNVTKENQEIPFYNVSFPNSLKSVKSFALDIEEVKNQCPELTSLECKTVRHAQNRGNSFKFPEKLTDLRVGLNVLEHIKPLKNDDEVVLVNDTKRRKLHSTSINLPKDLQSLHVTDDSWIDGHEIEFSESQTLFPNKEENILHNLTSMKLSDVTSYIRFGPIPQSLTHLEFISSDHRMKSLDDDFFENLKNLTNLKFLTIECPLDSTFECELPPKLQCFWFDNPNLCEVSIESESLKCLRIRNARFKVITSENFQIPESLVELVMIGCDIRSFDESFTFAKNLQILNLYGNSLERIPKLPPKLKSFSSNYRAVKPNQIEFAELPTTLEELDLEHFVYPVEYSFTPDLSHLMNLKKLSLSSRIFSSGSTKSFNLDNLPKSLTTISLPYCGIEKFTGTFTDFPNLEHLDLRSNYLGDWLSQSPNEFQFGAAIRTIHLKNNDLDFDTQLAIETVRNFLYNLKRKPNFRSLFVDDIHFPEDMQYLVMERYLVLQEQQ